MSFSNVSSLDLQLKDYRLTTAEILYHMPDHPHLLQTFVWQDYDLAPRFPVLNDFLCFWKKSLDGPLHSVRVAHKSFIQSVDIDHADGEFSIH